MIKVREENITNALKNHTNVKVLFLHFQPMKFLKMNKYMNFMNQLIYQPLLVRS